MTERRTRVRPVRVELECDVCRTGNMAPTGEVFASSPPQYPHECPTCHTRTVERKCYPFIEYENDGWFDEGEP